MDEKWKGWEMARKALQPGISLDFGFLWEFLSMGGKKNPKVWESTEPSRFPCDSMKFLHPKNPLKSPKNSAQGASSTLWPQGSSFPHFIFFWCGSKGKKKLEFSSSDGATPTLGTQQGVVKNPLKFQNSPSWCWPCSSSSSCWVTAPNSCKSKEKNLWGSSQRDTENNLKKLKKKGKRKRFLHAITHEGKTCKFSWAMDISQETAILGGLKIEIFKQLSRIWVWFFCCFGSSRTSLDSCAFYIFYPFKIQDI